MAMAWSNRYPPLHQAACSGDLEVVQRLVISGADLGAQDSNNRTPLMLAVVNGNESCANFLINRMTVQELNAVDRVGMNVLHMMAFFCRPWKEMIETIFEKCPYMIKQKDSNGELPKDTAISRLPKSKDFYEIFISQIRKCDNQEQQQQWNQHYTEGIADNVEHPCNITITVVGHNGVGKTCFVHQLKQEPIPEVGPGSTDTADFHINYLGYNPETGFRRKIDKDGEIETGRQRLKRIIGRYKKTASTGVLSSEKTRDSDDEDLTANATNLHQTANQGPEVDAHLWSARDTAGITQRLRQIISLILSPFKRKEREIHGVKTQHLVEITEEQKRVIKNVMATKLDVKKDEEIKGYVTIYDFGGEKVFYNTHHCFMSSNMVFVLVFDVAMCLDPTRGKDGYDRIDFWLRHIATYAFDDEARVNGTPPIILVGSHLDLVSESVEVQDKAFVSVLEKLCKNPELREIIERHVHEMFPIANLNDSTKNQEIYKQLWNKILEIAPLQSQWKKPVPARWIALEHELVRLKNADRVILKYDDLLEINMNLAVPLPEDALIEFLRKLRFSGTFLCFDLHSKNPFVVLQPQWVIEAFKAVITDPKFKTNLEIKLKLQWNQYEKSGVLKFAFIHKLWELDKEHRLLEEQDRLYVAMENLGLLSKPVSIDVEADYVIVPSMLQPADPEIICPILADPDTVAIVTLCIKFDNPFIPQAIWDKMIASCIHRFKELRKIGHADIRFIQRGFACLSVDCLWNMIINCSNNAMKVTMFKTDKDKTIPPGTGITLLRILEFLLQRILKFNHQSHLGYQFYLHSDHRFTPDDIMVKVEDLRQKERLQCHSSSGPKWIEQKDLYIWFKSTGQQVKQAQNHDVDKTNELPDRRLSFQELGRLSRHIGSTYMTFFVELNCPIVLVEQEMEENRHLAFRSRITKIFIHFIKTNGDIGFLAIADAMSRHGMDHSMLVGIQDCNRRMLPKGEMLPDKCLKRYLTMNDVPIITENVDIKAYFNLFLELGLTPSMVDEFDDHYRNKKTREKIAALLKAFITETKPRPTVNGILLAMQECDMNTEPLITAFKN